MKATIKIELNRSEVTAIKTTYANIGNFVYALTGTMPSKEDLDIKVNVKASFKSKLETIAVLMHLRDSVCYEMEIESEAILPFLALVNKTLTLATPFVSMSKALIGSSAITDLAKDFKTFSKDTVYKLEEETFYDDKGEVIAKPESDKK